MVNVPKTTHNIMRLKCTRKLEENSEDCKVALNYMYYTTKRRQNCKTAKYTSIILATEL
jgi:hypothetical protein